MKDKDTETRWDYFIFIFIFRRAISFQLLPHPKGKLELLSSHLINSRSQFYEYSVFIVANLSSRAAPLKISRNIILIPLIENLR